MVICVYFTFSQRILCILSYLFRSELTAFSAWEAFCHIFWPSLLCFRGTGLLQFQNNSIACLFSYQVLAPCFVAFLIHVFFIGKPLFCLSLNFLNFSRNWAWDFLKLFLTFTEINWLKWFALSLLILYTWIWIPSLRFWMQ